MTLPFLDHALQRILMRRAQRKFDAARPFVAGAGRVLDVGCGEGYVAAEAAGSASFVVAFDSRASCRVATRFLVADAAHLPFADDAFDVGLLAYVLHHTPDPDAVLREAVRTCRRVIVWESLFGSAAGKALLSFLDHRSNALRGVRRERLNFDRPEGWIRRFESAGARLAHRQRLGRFVHWHELFVFDRVRDYPRSI
jgi:SAM-dependent methyltransferase